ncbi:MAG: polymerase subunit sigma-70 [Rubritepida sp.]|nr:polymerase subunit sigma-70 [Rubritepida sp.]
MTPGERDALAAEYVLGTLDARATAELRGAMETDAALADAVAGWEQRLAPLQLLATPEAPPPDLWARLERTLGGGARRKAWRFPWPAFGLGAGALAAGLAAFIVFRPPPAAPLMTVLLTSRDQPAYLVEAERGTLRLAALNPRGIEAGRVMQLWALPQGATAPTSLGLIPESGRFSVTPQNIRPEPGMLIEISLEPPGGSTTGRPTGPILFIGRLSAAGNS